MEILSVITNRKAYRILSEKELPSSLINRIIEAGRLAPSCYNNQPWRILEASKDSLEALKASLSEGNAWALKAPSILAVATRASDDCRLDDGRDYALFDAGLCAMNMISQATAEGIVAHPIAGFNPKKAKAALGIPKEWVLIALIILAYRNEEPEAIPGALSPWQLKAETAPRDRKALEEIFSRDRWEFPDHASPS